MRILHTSDWHIGRSFHGNATLEALAGVLGAIVDQVDEHGVDVVVVAGDVFDSATPAAGAYTLLTDVLRRIREAGAHVVMTSGNHDSAARLGFQAPFLGAAGVHVVTDPASIGDPITIRGVDFYGIPYLEPALVRGVWPEAGVRTQEQAVRHAMGLVNAARAGRDRPSVAIAHCFAAGVEPTPQLEREVRADLRQGSLDVVPLADLAGPSYVALGHIHGRAVLEDRVRYSGAPLHYSFGEGSKPRGSWLVDIDDDGFVDAQWLGLPVPRPLVTLRGTLAELLEDPAHDAHTESWVCAVLTDRVPQPDPMRRLQARFPFCAAIQHDPAGAGDEPRRSYRERVGRAAPDQQIVGDFLDFVRRGEGASGDERALIAEVIGERRAAEQTA
ncbi:exonuclease SbcCD subunit D [Microbacterium indicum]|uniref:exonuclease SbcCD subunit D n=1 Tax=Microbacterium indicum TaxID=358100 RepID=UPI00048EDD16|nr:exonuclease SbcCD subunit D [Microbacterium indicum]